MIRQEEEEEGEDLAAFAFTLGLQTYGTEHNLIAASFAHTRVRVRVRLKRSARGGRQHSFLFFQVFFLPGHEYVIGTRCWRPGPCIKKWMDGHFSWASVQSSTVLDLDIGREGAGDFLLNFEHMRTDESVLCG
jgi:hypothetical protein